MSHMAIEKNDSWTRVPISQSPRYGLKYASLHIAARIHDSQLVVRVEDADGGDQVANIEIGPDAIVAVAILAAIEGALKAFGKDL